MIYLIPFAVSFISSIFLVKIIIFLSEKYKLFDAKGDRKIHTEDISRLGGLAILISFLFSIIVSGNLVFDSLKVGIVICSVLILIFGLWDDFKNISWKKQLIFQIALALVMIYFGLKVDYIANPFGGNEFRLDGFYWNNFSIISSIFILFWVLAFLNVINWLDGMDGMASGVGAIGAFTLFLLSVSDLVNQPPLAIMAISLAGSLLGFLIFNFHPAKIFMGSVGSWFLGFMLAILAIFAGAKIATVFLVFAIPFFDAVWVIVKRYKEGKSLFEGDKSHFYHNFLSRGWSQEKIVIFTYVLCAICSLFALYLEGLQKFWAIVFIFFIVFLASIKFKFGKNI